MATRSSIAILALLLPAASGFGQQFAAVEPFLGPAPRMPDNLLALPRSAPRKLDTSPAFSVDGNSREQVRQFYNAVYAASEGVPINSTANIANCVAGANSPDFQNAVLWRINWFRAMSGVPAAVIFSSSENDDDQSAALLIAANNQLLHYGIPPSWSCFSPQGTNAAADSNLALGVNGPEAITGYIWDYGAANAQVAHRRWLLYPQTQVMATGDVPAQSTYAAANATWVLDANNGGPRPDTTAPYVAWPPPGFVPFQVVFPQWSFALSNADLSTASVVMQSNGVPMSVAVQPYETGYGENTLVWYPSGLDPAGYATVFPFNGADTVYSITINNARTIAGPQSFGYNVTVFDPALPGADYVPTTITGTNRPSIRENNPYSCAPSANPNNTGYQWVSAQAASGNLTDNALKGLTNFTISPPPAYSPITNPPVGLGKCFHLAHTAPAPQLLEFKEILFPSANTSLLFHSLLGYATTNEVARVQISTNGGGAWVDVYAQQGAGGSGESAFVPRNLSLSNCAGKITRVRFNYDYSDGSYFSQSSPNAGWCLENIIITNASQLVNPATNATASTNLNFSPAAAGAWILEARPILFNQFGLDWSPPMQLVAVTNTAPALISLGFPTITASQAQIPFTLTQGAASSFNLLQAAQITGPWAANASAVLSTRIPGTSFQFTEPRAAGTTFYRVLAH